MSDTTSESLDSETTWLCSGRLQPGVLLGSGEYNSTDNFVWFYFYFICIMSQSLTM